MVDAAPSPVAVVQRLMALTRRGKIKWERAGNGMSDAFELKTASSQIFILPVANEVIRMQIRPTPAQFDELGPLPPEHMFGVNRPDSNIRSDDPDSEVGRLVRMLYGEIAARVTVQDDPLARLWTDLDDAFGS
jgi:hypothetical protein